MKPKQPTTALEWLERTRYTLDQRTRFEDDAELIDAHDDICNAIEALQTSKYFVVAVRGYYGEDGEIIVNRTSGDMSYQRDPEHIYDLYRSANYPIIYCIGTLVDGIVELTDWGYMTAEEALAVLPKE